MISLTFFVTIQVILKQMCANTKVIRVGSLVCCTCDGNSRFLLFAEEMGLAREKQAHEVLSMQLGETGPTCLD